MTKMADILSDWLLEIREMQMVFNLEFETDGI